MSLPAAVRVVPSHATTCFATPPLTSFNVTYCLSVRGKGLENGQTISEHPHKDLFPSCRETSALPLCPADVNYVLLSDPTRAQPRTILNEQMETEQKGVLLLEIEGSQVCEEVTVHIRVCGASEGAEGTWGGKCHCTSHAQLRTWTPSTKSPFGQQSLLTFQMSPAPLPPMATSLQRTCRCPGSSRGRNRQTHF